MKGKRPATEQKIRILREADGSEGISGEINAMYHKFPFLEMETVPY